jgi:glyoxylase-like metal-dependent hydrolase (beta-lactamase superfamily II)
VNANVRLSTQYAQIRRESLVAYNRLRPIADGRSIRSRNEWIAEMTKLFYQEWFEVWEPEPGVHVIQEPHHSENVKSYLVLGDRRAVLIDTGMGIGDIKSVVDDLTKLPVTVLNSHAHWDHIGGNWRFDEILIHRAEAEALGTPPAAARLRTFFSDQFLSAPLPDDCDLSTFEIRPSRATTLLDGGETIDLGGRTLRIIHAPGHSPGGIVVVDDDNKLLFTTDVAYASRLYAFLSHSNVGDYRETLARLEPIAAVMRALFPSHDATPIEPALVGQMRAAFDEVIAGRVPEQLEGDVALHEFGRFSIAVPARLPVREPAT